MTDQGDNSLVRRPRTLFSHVGPWAAIQKPRVLTFFGVLFSEMSSLLTSFKGILAAIAPDLGPAENVSHFDCANFW